MMGNFLRYQGCTEIAKSITDLVLVKLGVEENNNLNGHYSRLFMQHTIDELRAGANRKNEEDFGFRLYQHP